MGSSMINSLRYHCWVRRWKKWKSVNICGSYGQLIRGGGRFYETRCTYFPRVPWHRPASIPRVHRHPVSVQLVNLEPRPLSPQSAASTLSSFRRHLKSHLFTLKVVSIMTMTFASWLDTLWLCKVSLLFSTLCELDWPLCHCAVAQAPPFNKHRRPLAPSKFFDK